MNKVKLSSLLDIRRGQSLSGDYYSESGQLKRLTLGNFDYPSGGFKENTAKKDIYFVGDIGPEFILSEGDIITPLTEQVAGLLGETATIPCSNVYIQSGDIGLVVPNESNADKRFLAYLISSPIVKKQLAAGAQQTKIRHTSPEAIKDCTVWIPETVAEQNRISTLLDFINSEIKLNSSICSDLEATAKLLYDYWFVQFDFPDEDGRPYKSSGGKMVWNDELKREIPAGWSVGNLYDIAEYANGLACQKYRPLEGDKGLPVIKIKEMHGGYSSETERVKSNIPDKNIVRPGDLLFSWSASLEIMIWTRQTGGLNQHIFKVIPKRPFNRSYVYFQLGSYLAQFKRMAESRKTTMGHITSDHLEQSRIVLPPSTLLDMYSNKTSSLIDQIVEVSGVAETLTDIRDYTLPLLMNGQVTIGDDDT